MATNFVKMIGINIMLLAYPLAQAYAAPVVNFDLGQSSTLQNPLPFYCSIGNASDSDKVDMKNKAVLITGFAKNGRLSGTVRMVNTVYFKSYHDPSYRNQDGIVFIRIQNSSANINCYYGVPPGRTLMPGNYGMP